MMQENWDHEAGPSAPCSGRSAGVRASVTPATSQGTAVCAGQ